MITVRNFRYAELREKVAETILEALAQLPEPQRSIFVWNHYYGYRVEQIAEILKWTVSDVETTLGSTNSMLYQKARALLAGDDRVDTKAKLSGSVVSDEVGCCYLLSSSIKPDWGSHAQV
jgi:Sigma-70, region 4